jgi:hypothetical protein
MRLTKAQRLATRREAALEEEENARAWEAQQAQERADRAAVVWYGADDVFPAPVVVTSGRTRAKELITELLARLLVVGLAIGLLAILYLLIDAFGGGVTCDEFMCGDRW